MISLYSNGASTSRDSGSLLEKKKLQWAKERAEAADEWFPFGRPGAGAPQRSSIRRSSSGQRSLSQSRLNNGHNQSQELVSPATSPTNGPPNGIPMYQSYHQGYQGPQGLSIPPPGPNMAQGPGAQAQQYQAQPQGAYPHPQVPYYHSMVVNGGDNYQPVPYAMVQGPNGQIYQPLPPAHGHKNLAAIPSSSTAENYAPIPAHQAISTPNGTTLIPLNPDIQHRDHPGLVPNPSLSYTEQWANQLPYWEPGAPSDITSPPSNMTSLPQLKQPGTPNLQGSNQSVYGGSISTIAQDPRGMTRSMGNLAPPQTAWVAPQPQRTAVVQPQPSLMHPTSLALDQSLNSSIGKLNGYSPMGQPNGYLDNSLGASQHLYTPLQQSFDAMSSGTGHSASGGRRRRITGPTEDEDWDKTDRSLEQKMILDEQVADKQREKMMEAERERLEQERAAEEMRRIVMRETLENEAERHKWKDLWDSDQKREQLLLKSLEKAKEEARLLKEAKLMHHASKGSHSPLGQKPSLTNGHSYNYDTMDDENLSQVSKSIDALERAREEAEAMVRKEKLKKDLEKQEQRARYEEERRMQEQQQLSTSPASSTASRSKSVPPSKASFSSPSLSSPFEDRPIKPAQKDPLEIWDQIMENSDSGNNIDNETPRRRAPVRQSMRTKSKNSDVAAMRKNRRADSLERLAKKAEDAENSAQSVPQRPPRNKKKDKLDTASVLSSETYTVRDEKKPKKKSKDRHQSPSSKKPPSAPPPPTALVKPRKSSTKPPKTNRSPKEGAGAPEHGDKGRKLLNRRPSIEHMLYPPGEKMTSSSDSDGASSAHKKAGKKEENPWGDSLGGLNPLLQPLSTRTKPRRSKDKPPRTSSKSPARPSKAEPIEAKPAANDSKTTPKGQQSDENSNHIHSTPENDKNNNHKTHAHPIKEKRTESVDSRSRKPVFSGSGQTPASVRVRGSEEEDDQSWRPLVRGGLRASASMENFNAKSPLYSSIRSKRSQPTGRQQKILDQLASLRQQLKSKQKQVEDSFITESKSPRIGHSKTDLFENHPTSDC